MAPSHADNQRPESSLRTARRGRAMRQADLAEQADCSVSLVSMAEAGYVPTLPVRERIAVALGASPGSFWS